MVAGGATVAEGATVLSEGSAGLASREDASTGPDAAGGSRGNTSLGLSSEERITAFEERAVERASGLAGMDRVRA